MSSIASQIMGHRGLPSFSINDTWSSDCDGADPSKSTSRLAAEKTEVLQPPNAFNASTSLMLSRSIQIVCSYCSLNIVVEGGSNHRGVISSGFLSSNVSVVRLEPLAAKMLYLPTNLCDCGHQSSILDGNKQTRVLKCALDLRDFECRIWSRMGCPGYQLRGYLQTMSI